MLGLQRRHHKPCLHECKNYRNNHAETSNGMSVLFHSLCLFNTGSGATRQRRLIEDAAFGGFGLRLLPVVGIHHRTRRWRVAAPRDTRRRTSSCFIGRQRSRLVSRPHTRQTTTEWTSTRSLQGGRARNVARSTAWTRTCDRGHDRPLHEEVVRRCSRRDGGMR